ncbi:hypothetical protein Rumeso_04212 [Rubellimicrobium mesophilum DSM 19309]|uniref:Uncharacterized protein n=1 Tax=Rubellimicrobium mesophilum DSM 19309 TaxID=442562 RepID=A0A017HIK8_9RHOB|nr:hypothetical protein Rumeso_04212 [Rubellimicrobium mesophilum DSM 19309]
MSHEDPDGPARPHSPGSGGSRDEVMRVRCRSRTGGLTQR